jgi:hypothetical protein
MSLAQGTDMGFFIPHIPLPPAPANILAPIITLASGSKSHFGAHNHKTPKGPLAFACLVVVNLNLNCGGPTRPPLPSGFVFAVFQLTWQGVTWGDIIAGALHMLVDALVQFGINRFLSTGLGGKALNWLTGKIASAIASRVAVMGVRLSTLGVKSLGDLIQAVMGGSRLSRFLGYGFAEQLPGILAGLGIGTPIGYSPDRAPTSQGESLVDGADGKDGLQAKAAGGIDRALDRMFNSPAVEQHPSAPPAETGGDAGDPPGSSGGSSGGPSSTPGSDSGDASVPNGPSDAGGSSGGPSSTPGSGSGDASVPNDPSDAGGVSGGPSSTPGSGPGDASVPSGSSGSGGSSGGPSSTPGRGSGDASVPSGSSGSGGSSNGPNNTPGGGPGGTSGPGNGSGGASGGPSSAPASGAGGACGPDDGSGGSSGGPNSTPASRPGGTSGTGGSNAPSGSSGGPNYTPASGTSGLSGTGGGTSTGSGPTRSGGGN